MGIISFGKIGQSVAIRAMSFGVKIIVYDPYVSESLAQEFGVKLASKSLKKAQKEVIRRGLNKFENCAT